MTEPSPTPLDPRRIALIGFGEVGQRFGKEFLATGKFDVATYDILFNNSPEGAALRDTEVIGQASAIKMCRSIMIKGIEALAVECFLTSRSYGVEETIIGSLEETFPEMDWEKLAGYLVGRVVQHGRRRAAEMREVGETETAMGLTPLMATATAERQDWLADEAVAAPELKAFKDEEWRDVPDKLIARIRTKAQP